MWRSAEKRSGEQSPAAPFGEAYDALKALLARMARKRTVARRSALARFVARHQSLCATLPSLPRRDGNI